MKPNNGQISLRHEWMSTAAWVIIATSILIMTGCEKDANVVQPGDNSQIFLLSHAVSDDPVTPADVDRTRCFSITMYKAAAFEVDGSVTTFEEINIAMSHRFTDDFKQYVDYGTLTYAGHELDRYHMYNVVDIPDSGGIPAHKDTTDITTYSFTGEITNDVRIPKTITITASNSSWIQDFSDDFTVNVPQVEIVNVNQGATVSAANDLTLQLNKELNPGSRIEFVPKDPPLAGDSTYSGFLVLTLEITQKTNTVTVPASELAALKAKWNADTVTYIIGLDDAFKVGDILTTDKRTGSHYSLPVILNSGQSLAIHLTE